MIATEEIRNRKRGIFWLLISVLFLAVSFIPNNSSLSDNMQYAWVQIAAALIPAIMGMVQAGMAAKAAKSAGNRPQMQIPQAQMESMEVAKRLANMRTMPGYAQMMNQQNLANAEAIQNTKMNAGGSPASLGVAADLYAKQLQNQNALGINNANFQIGQQQQLLKMLGGQASWQNKLWETNTMEPYQNTKAAQSALTNAAMSNVTTGANNLAGTLAWQDLLKKSQNTDGNTSTLTPEQLNALKAILSNQNKVEGE